MNGPFARKIDMPAMPPTVPEGKDPPDALRMRLDLYNNADFDRGAGRVREGLWVLCKSLFFLNSIPWPSGLRNVLLRAFGARLGSNVIIRSGVNISFPWRFAAGDNVWIGEQVFILSLAPVTLGSHVCISQRAFLCTGSHSVDTNTFDLHTAPVDVEDGVWIAAQAFVGPGVCVGRNSIVAAGAIVMRAIAPNSIARGNPISVSPRSDI